MITQNLEFSFVKKRDKVIRYEMWIRVKNEERLYGFLKRVFKVLTGCEIFL